MSDTRIRGIQRILKAVGVGHRSTLRGLRDRPFDPLPSRYQLGRAWVWSERLVLWKRREAKDPTLPKADGWAAIAKAIGVARCAAMRYAAAPQHPLPVHGIGTERVWAHISALQDWLDGEDEPGCRRAKTTAMRTARPKAVQREAGLPQQRSGAANCTMVVDHRRVRVAASSRRTQPPRNDLLPVRRQRSGGTMGAES